jgi:hypothetical protein
MLLRTRIRVTAFAISCFLTGLWLVAVSSPIVAGVDDPKLERVDLSKADANFTVTMEVPAGAKVSDGLSGPEIVVGETFKIQVSGTAADMAKRKEEIKSNSLNKLKQYVVEKDDTLLYESEVFKAPEFHFVVNIMIGNKTYCVEDVKGPNYTKEQCELMLKCAKSLKIKE